MNATDSQLKALVMKYLSSPAGKEYMKQEKIALRGYSKEELKAAAQELKESLIDAFLAEQTQPESEREFARGLVRVNIRGSDTTGYKASITFYEDALSRESLLGIDGQTHTGDGVYDIFGLFTQGYHASKRVIGWWVTYDERGSFSGDKYDRPIPSLQTRYPSNFISDTIRAFERKYPGIYVKYPDLWKSSGPFGV